MSRKYLQERKDKVITIKGNFARYGVKDGKNAKWSTGLIENAETLTGEFVSNHLWFTMVGKWLNTQINQKSKLKITGTIKEYKRKNDSISYGIEQVTDIEILKQGNKIIPCKQWNITSMNITSL